MCGGELQINPGESVAVCEYCGTTQTLPKLDDDRRANLYDRANHFRRNNDFDKAAGIYEQILNEDKTDAEAYWSLVLCRYGIEYVEDPATHKRVPTVNRAQYTSIFDDEDYKAAIQYADAAQRVVYEAEAKVINEIQKGILEISQKEELFDVFICYKETDANGRRTPDSVLATDLYYQLTQEGFKVFFSRITLEDKLGTAYEPYIFAALNSAKVMVVLGTKPEYFNAVWVKNEWSRYLALIRGGAKKVLIPAYRDMDPYDLPEEFSHLQAQDMSKLGFMQDLIRGIKKLTEVDKPAARETVVVQETTANTAPLLKRAFIFLEDGDWDSADEYCEKVLDLDPECAQAYLGKLMADLRVRKVDDLANCEQPFDDKDNYRKVMRFGDETLRDTLEDYITHINDRDENARLTGIYNDAANAMSRADSEDAYRSAADKFKSIPDFKDADALAESCLDKAEICRKDGIYSSAKSKIAEDSTASCEEALQMFQSIFGWKDADEQICACQKRIEEIKAKEKAERLEAERKAEERRIAANKARRKRKKAFVIGAPIVCACMAFVIVLTTVIIPKQKYNKAIHLLDSGDYAEAAITFGSLGNYKDARDRCIPLFQLFSDSLSANNHTVALKADGTVMATGYNAYGECDVSDWKDVVDVSAGYNYTISLKANGTVVAAGYNEYGQCDVLDWVDIVSVSAGHNHTIGLKADGTVVATGNNASRQCNVSNWKDIVAVSAGHNHTIGLKADGTVVATGYNEYGQCDVLGWTDIVSVSAGNDCTIGLKTDGTVVAVGYNEYGQCDVLDWVDIVAVSAGHNHTIGLKADGTVVAAGRNHFGQCNVSDWVDIVAVSAGHNHTIGLKADGTLVATGSDRNRQCDVSDWTNITTKQPMA
jgi:alpha-tubulin suppressor-like RCC1 family protein/predicted transcriptional regulator